MTTFGFTPTATAPYRFQPTLDGAVYSATVTWNLFAQRWYLNLSDLSGNRIFSLPVVGSSAIQPLAALAWQNGTVTATTQDPHGYAIGIMIALTVSGATPGAYNGSFPCLTTGPSSFTYPLSADPDPPTTSVDGLQTASAPGAYSFDLNIAAGYFTTSTLVYRTSSGNFEITP